MEICDLCGNTIATVNENQICKSCMKSSDSEKNTSSHKKILDRAADSRKTAKSLGAKALTGSAKQKAWGEKIRADFLSFSQNEVVLDMIVNSAMTQTAKFWIETRNVGNSALENAFVNLVEATKKANEIGAGNDGYDQQLAIRSTALKTLTA